MSIVNTIKAALENHLITMPGVFAVHPQNVSYDPDPNTSFIRSTFVATNIQPAVRGLNPSLRYNGFFTMLICTPEGNGLGAAMAQAEALMDRFRPTTDISYSGIILSVEDATMSNDYYSPPFNCLPVTVNWYIYSTN
jgi:hypothetical protein